MTCCSASSTATGERWPVIDGIAYLRTGREALVADVLKFLDDGREIEALVALLADQDDWWTGAPADPAHIFDLVSKRDATSLRDAMESLGFGRVRILSESPQYNQRYRAPRRTSLNTGDAMRSRGRPG